MRVTYYALRDVRVGDEVRQCGDLVPEACTWPYLSGYIQDGHISPVLVATLPEEQQEMLLEWEEDVLGVTHEDIPVSEEIEVPEPEAEFVESVEESKTVKVKKPKKEEAV